MKLSQLIQKKRKDKKLKIRELAAILSVDASLISRFEKGDRLPTEKQLSALCMALDLSFKDAMIFWLSDQVVKTYAKYEFTLEALKVAEEEIKYHYTAKTNNPKSYASTIKKIEALKTKLMKLRHTDSEKIAEALELEYTYNSNKIEGNTLTLQETNLVVNEGLTISGKPMREHLEAINHSDAIAYLKELIKKDTPISERVIMQLHQLVLRGIDKDNAGVYRKVQVMISGSSHIPPAPYLIAKKMEDLMIWYQINKIKLHPVVLAAEMHERLVTIHPFIDGNGRTSRLLMNLILLQNGYTIADIKGDKNQRQEYYQALDASRNKGDDKRAFIQFILEIEMVCLKRYISILE